MSMRIDVEFDRESKTYFPDQFMGGQVVVYVTGEMRIESILVCITGMATVHRDPPITKTQRRERMKRHAYFDKIASLYTGKQNEEDEKLFPEGKNIFPFRFRLPKNLPSSLESSIGHVRYWVRALVDETDKLTESAVHLFSVNALVDLNRLSRASLPICGTERITKQRLVCLCHRSMSGRLHLQRRAFVSGEVITVDVDIENMSADPVAMTKLSLVQVVVFRSTRGKKERQERRVAAERVRGVILPFEAQTWRGESLEVPPLPSSSPPNALIVTQYYVILEVQSRREKMSFKIQVPILIGCVPLKQCLHHFEDGSGDQTVPGQDWPVPNYESCVFGPHDMSGDGVPPVFSPCYVSYTITKNVNKDSSSTTSCDQ